MARSTEVKPTQSDEPMKVSILNRRRFLQHSAAGVTAAAMAKRHSLHAANKAANKLRVGVMGLGPETLRRRGGLRLRRR